MTPLAKNLCHRLALTLGLALGQVGFVAAADWVGPPKVIDGDTLEVRGKVFRLHGIDAPELGQACAIRSRLYDCGLVARTALLDLTAGAKVVCTLLTRSSDAPADAPANEGQPGRFAAGGYDLSEGMAYTGWALAQREQTTRYLRFEAQAKSAGRGLWKGAFVTPWDWRRGKRLPEESRPQ